MDATPAEDPAERCVAVRPAVRNICKVHRIIVETVSPIDETVGRAAVCLLVVVDGVAVERRKIGSGIPKIQKLAVGSRVWSTTERVCGPVFVHNLRVAVLESQEGEMVLLYASALHDDLAVLALGS